jgi:pimeloyl-ACP methyl ester carboxylesterase
MATDVSFASNGNRIAAHLYLPGHVPGPHPAIVCCHGFTGVKERFYPKFGATMTAAGFAVLAFDYQCRGESEGLPRGDLDPMAFVENARDAISFVRSCAWAKPGAVGLFGVSFGGAIALQTAAVDRRVGATIVAGPVSDAGRWLRGLRHPHDWEALLRRIDADRERRFAGERTQDVPVYELMVPDPESAAHFKEITTSEAPRMSMVTNLHSAERLLHFSPERWVDTISPRAVMVIAAPTDTIVPTDEALAAFNRCGPPKELVLLPPDVSHWAIYEHPLVAEKATKWYRQHLGQA